MKPLSKRIVGLSLLLLATLQLNARIGVEYGLYGEVFGVKDPYSYTFKVLPVGGGMLYFQAGRFVTLNYAVGFSAFDSDKKCIRSSAGMIVGGALAHEGAPLGVLLGIIPQGMGFYTRSDHTGLHISINFLAMDYYYVSEVGNRERWEMPLGATFRYRFSNDLIPIMAVPYLNIGIGPVDPICFMIGCQFTLERPKLEAMKREKRQPKVEPNTGDEFEFL